MNTPSPPIPKNEEDARRWEHTRLRRRMLYGEWEKDLDQRLRQQIGNVRKEAWGSPDLSSNVFRSVVSQLAVQYDVWPTIGHDDGAAELTAAIEQAGLFPLLSRVQRDCLGLREMFVRVDVAGDGGLTFRPVFPDLVVAESHPDRPAEPVVLKEARLRNDPVSGRSVWCWDICDISNTSEPSFKIVSQDGSDLTESFTGIPDLSGENYPYRRSNNQPFIPYAVYHASETACLWDAFEAQELVQGSLTCAVLWSFYAHAVRSASWPQRYAVSVEVPNLNHVDSENGGVGRSAIVTDPATVLMLKGAEDGVGQPMIGQWASGADPEVLQKSIVAYERRLASFAGLTGSDILRQSGDPRSGYAISVSRSAQREAQRRWEPQFRAGDLRLLTISAALLNRAHGADLPETGYRIGYAGIPLSPEEIKGQREQITTMLQLGLMDKVDAYQSIHAGTSRPDAMKALAEIAQFETRLEEELKEQSTDSTIEVATSISTGTEKAQDTALNGAQVTAAQGIVVAVAQGELPRDSGIQMLSSFFNMSKDKATAIMATVGAGFSIETESE